MRLFECQCESTLFFHNTVCVTCGCEVGFCPACRKMTALQPQDDGSLQCAHDDCGAPLAKCHNYAVAGVCNWCLVPDETESEVLCASCRLTRVIPDLSVPDNRRRWADLEQAKRRVLYGLDLLGLTYTADDGALPLSFEFKGDIVDNQTWRPIAGGGQVFTGHADGVVTINICEADSIARERSRVWFGEDLRTLVGHFRHEIGHYFWQRLVQPKRVKEFVKRFGDHTNPPYEQAKQQYYQQGPPANWHSDYISAYAAMHPWEDFAETFASYLDITTLLDTAGHTGIIDPVDLSADIETLVSRYQGLGIGINEINREMGLLDPAPFLLSPTVVRKLDFVHSLTKRPA